MVFSSRNGQSLGFSRSCFLLGVGTLSKQGCQYFSSTMLQHSWPQLSLLKQSMTPPSSPALSPRPIPHYILCHISCHQSMGSPLSRVRLSWGCPPDSGSLPIGCCCSLRFSGQRFSGFLVGRPNPGQCFSDFSGGERQGLPMIRGRPISCIFYCKGAWQAWLWVASYTRLLWRRFAAYY